MFRAFEEEPQDLLELGFRVTGLGKPYNAPKFGQCMAR
jgi:hypothetical protein